MVIYALKRKDSESEIPDHLFLNLDEVDDFLKQPKGYTKKHATDDKTYLVSSDGTVYEMVLGVS